MGGGQRRRRRLALAGASAGAGAGAGATAPCHAGANAEVTLALVGKIGTGKSATGNSILGNKAFTSKRWYGGVTKTCLMRSRTFHDGSASRTLNVIDTPGLFDMDIKAEDIKEEIIKCMKLAKEGIHAMLMVFSAISRFSNEDEKTVETIKLFFGDKILDHMIFVFTSGDQLDEDETTWKERLTETAPKYFQEILKIFKDRVVLFDNSNTQYCKSQRETLLRAVDSVILINGGKPFSNQMFTEIKKANQMSKSDKATRDEYFTEISKMVDDKLSVTTEMLEKRLEEEKKARQHVENEIQRLRERLHDAEKENDKLKGEHEKLKGEPKPSEKGKGDSSKRKEDTSTSTSTCTIL